MKASEIKQPGFYWWQCPNNDGPQYKRGRPRTIVQIGVDGFGYSSSNPCEQCFFPGDPATYITSRLPGEFVGPITYNAAIQGPRSGPAGMES